MRVVLGWLLLVGLFALAGALHGAWTEGVRRERDRLYAERSDGPSAPPETGFATSGRGRLLIGRPSGAAAIELAPAAPAAQAPASSPRLSAAVEDWSSGADVAEGEAPPEWSPPVYEMTVQVGQVLSVICQEFYGTGRPPIPDLVARYNGLKDADSVRAGQKLLLPPLEELRAAAGGGSNP